MEKSEVPGNQQNCGHHLFCGFFCGLGMLLIYGLMQGWFWESQPLYRKFSRPELMQEL